MIYVNYVYLCEKSGKLTGREADIFFMKKNNHPIPARHFSVLTVFGSVLFDLYFHGEEIYEDEVNSRQCKLFLIVYSCYKNT